LTGRAGLPNLLAMDDDAFAKARALLLAEINDQARLTRAMTGREHFSDTVMAAMAAVPRHAFVRPKDRSVAYADRPQPIGHGQTISQPYMVALMTEILDLTATDRVLEIGAGSGYQTAVLAEVAERVYTVEVIGKLAAAAEERIAELGYDNVAVRLGDGFKGWPEEAPFDAVIVTAAPEAIPDILVEQLATGGRLVIPIGKQHGAQTLIRGVKMADGSLQTKKVLPVAFVPMVAGKG
jgi:protein-L-isoaspartate(D-aspartate) O-methyltransferase